MNLPNKLTLLRVCLIPVFLLFVYVSAIPCHYLLALIVFAAASLTDMLDGKIARKHNLVTNFGKFLDRAGGFAGFPDECHSADYHCRQRIYGVRSASVGSRRRRSNSSRHLGQAENCVHHGDPGGQLAVSEPCRRLHALHAGLDPDLDVKRFHLDFCRTDHSFRYGLSKRLLEIHQHFQIICIF